MITFDPASLERRLAELEEEMNEPGFWDDQEPRREGLGRARARRAAARGLPARCAREYEDASELARARPGEMADEIEASIAPLRARARAAAGGRAVRRRVRRRRRRRHAAVRHGRHRRAGLGRDDAADVRALGGRTRLQGRAARGEPGRGGRPQVRDVHRRRRERLRHPQGRARQAPARPPERRSTRRTAATPRSRP